MFFDAIRSVFSKTGSHPGLGLFHPRDGHASHADAPTRPAANTAGDAAQVGNHPSFASTAPGIFGILAGGDR